MSKTKNEVINKILDLLKLNSYTSEFKNNKLKYNDEIYNLPIEKNILNSRNTKIR